MWTQTNLFTGSSLHEWNHIESVAEGNALVRRTCKLHRKLQKFGHLGSVSMRVNLVKGERKKSPRNLWKNSLSPRGFYFGSVKRYNNKFYNKYVKVETVPLSTERFSFWPTPDGHHDQINHNEIGLESGTGCTGFESPWRWLEMSVGTWSRVNE